MLKAQQSLKERIEKLCLKDSAFREEVQRGKMFGILLVEGRPDFYLAAFSGQICGSFSLDGFVPAVCDYLSPQGYFKTHEREITQINHIIEERESSPQLSEMKDDLDRTEKEAQADIDGYKAQILEARERRNEARREGIADEDALIRESQFMKAELHRKKVLWRGRIEAARKMLDDYTAETGLLKLRRQRLSDSLQRWLFSQFILTSHSGERRSLLEIYGMQFRSAVLPPSGSGECCEPKLLSYAYTHGLTPREIGMFWWGATPKKEIRRHLGFYPACSGKCRPILKFMLGRDFSETDIGNEDAKPEVLFEDDEIIVVNKPWGMLSVPGKSGRESVMSLLRKSRPGCGELQTVHRLDMDTSGLLLLAKTRRAHQHLQRQFAQRTIRKRYVALLENDIEGEGTITLPLAPDFTDRPRQMADHERGKAAVTDWRALGGRRVELTPHTGRTHQLRVHCAHKEGLSNPIEGDVLYGRKASRLYLHAEFLELTHPVSGKRISFQAPPEF